MHTTIALQPETHERLAALKHRKGLASMDAAVRHLLEGRVETAQSLFRHYEAEVRAVCDRHGVTRMVAFGSRARGDARQDSDLDLVINLPHGKSLFDLAHIMMDLEAILGVKVDLTTFGPHLGRLQASIDRDGVRLLG